MNNTASDFYSQHFEVAGFIREVFGYMDRFKGQLFVLKIDDGLMDHPLFPVLMRDIALLHKAGIRIIIVPGTRNSIDAQLKAWELESKFEGGVRLTSEEALPLIEQASLGVAQRIMSHLTASGLSGIQGNWVLARSLGVIGGVDYMRTGKIRSSGSSAIFWSSCLTRISCLSFRLSAGTRSGMPTISVLRNLRPKSASTCR